MPQFKPACKFDAGDGTIFSDACVIIPAAGQGERLGLGPKALLEVDGIPLLTWLSRKVLKFCNEIVVAVPPGTGISFHPLCPGCRCIEGGPTRQESVRRLMESTRKDWIVIADVARPFASASLFFSVLQTARKTGVAGAFLRPDVPVARIAEDRVIRDYQRYEMGVFQSQEAFSRKLLEQIYTEALEKKWEEQSTRQLALRAGLTVGAVPGEKTNIKLTTQEDWQVAQLYKEFLI